MPGVPELLVILVIVLLVFGAGKLPQIGDALGRSIKNFRRASSGDNELEVSRRDEVTAGKQRDELERGSVEEADLVDRAEPSKKAKAE